MIDELPNYMERVSAANRAWKAKTSSKSKADAFRTVRQTLASMCIGPTRCAYCEDSLADEIEHIQPKNFFPERVFVWENYLFACGPCNGPKGNRYGILNNNVVEEIVRAPKGKIHPLPAGQSALINPRTEDPLLFLELDMGGITPEGIEIPGTFEFLPRDTLNAEVQARAVFSIYVLGLNREVIRVARENAFGGFRALLREFVNEKVQDAPQKRLDELRDDLLSTPHLTVFAEMRRQQHYFPALRALFKLAPEAEEWPIVPTYD